ncbi:MAG TPA: sugar transferase [Fulvivirga sp.]|nr:sugar transferase [Fulvivirga sp.]
MRKSYKLAKRAIDVGLSLIILISISPIMVIILLINQLGFNRIFFLQKRVGQHGKSFTIIKLCTMDGKGHIGPFHGFLRHTGIDEIPQLVNILKGEMSLVGPRPILIEYINHLNQDEKNRFLVKPGITGYAQIMGRNKLSWKQKFVYDLEYVNNQSLFNDLMILIKTPYKIFKSGNIQAQSLIDERN